MMLKAGFCSVDITPKKLYPMAGYDLRKDCAEGAHDAILARTVVMESESLVCALCTMDLLGASVDTVEEIRTRVEKTLSVPKIVCQIGATHTHAAPEAVFTDAEGYDEDYRRFVIDAVVKSIVNAYDNRHEVALHYAHTKVEGVASRRDVLREESAYKMPCDTLWLKAVDKNQRDILVSVFACHPTVLNEANRLMSGDLVWASDSHMKKRASDMDVLFINGACGDLSTRYTRLASSYEDAERMGTLWTEGVLCSLQNAEAMEAAINYKEHTLFIPPADFFTPEQIPQALEHLEDKINACTDDQEKREYIACRSVLVRSCYGIETGCDAKLGMLSVGKVVLCSLPFEYASADADPLREQMEKMSDRTFVICGYTHGYEGYLPSGRPLDFDSGYEDIASPFCHNAKELVAKAFLSMIETL